MELLLSWLPMGVAQKYIFFFFLFWGAYRDCCIRPWPSISSSAQPLFAQKILLREERLANRWLMEGEPWTIAADQINDGDEHATTYMHPTAESTNMMNTKCILHHDKSEVINDILNIKSKLFDIMGCKQTETKWNTRQLEFVPNFTIWQQLKNTLKFNLFYDTSIRYCPVKIWQIHKDDLCLQTNLIFCIHMLQKEKKGFPIIVTITDAFKFGKFGIQGEYNYLASFLKMVVW